MDVFELRDRVTADYARYMRSFIEIRDLRVSEKVDEQLPKLWPDPLIQLNPAFEPGASMDELIADGLLHPDCREIFATEVDSQRRPLQLYHHQIEGIRAARAGDNYVLTTGTGSGKSLSYIVPIVDHVLRTPKSERRGIQAIVVYPMNALANSQRGELEKYLGAGPTPAVTFESYTGQDDSATKQRIANSPPDILLTNYVMLELILTRTDERKLIGAANELRFLVFDELHTYRGRQGADVALLCRRVREACRTQRLIHVGTSATLAGEGSWHAQQSQVAKVASTIFGAPVSPRRVIGETLRRVTPEFDFDDPKLLARLRERVGAPAPATDAAFVIDPLAAWIESTLGVQQHDGRLVRQQPKTIVAVGQALAHLLELPADTCQAAVRDTLMAGYARKHGDRPVFAFRLHQFIAKGDTVYASLAAPLDRFLTTQSQRFVPDSHRKQVLLPLCFCRECGQDFYTVRRQLRKDGTISYVGRDAGDQADQVQTDEDVASEAGFLYVSTERPWPRDVESVIQMIPESWVEERRGKLAIRRERKERLPMVVMVSADGIEGHGELEAAYFRAPFLFCPTCGVTYDARQLRDFGKIGTLGSEGRSTATTILSLATLRRLGGLPANARKLLSFTDNRQDAALQAGHFNDFVSLGLVRSGLYQALDSRAETGPASHIDHDELTQTVFDALDLPMRLYAANPDVVLGQRERTQAALRRVLGYFLYRDLARGWRLTSPNLEQCGLLNIAYRDLDRFCADPQHWTGHHTLAVADPDLRFEICTTLLNFLRRELAINVEALDPNKQDQIRLDANQLLIDPWRLGEGEQLVQNYVALLGSGGQTRGKPFVGGRVVFVSPRGGFGQYLRRREVLGSHGGLGVDETQTVIQALITALTRLGVLCEVTVSGRGVKATGYQISAASMLWSRGTAERAAHDVIRVPQAPERGLRPNEFFRSFYKGDARDLAHYQAHEHTAQVRADVREQREDDFRQAKLPLLFCSPTMELGVDISELNIVNMRNVPPTPANYAQRSGRAGRSGQPAFVFTYCTSQSPHDQYFFGKPERMVAGQVRTPCLDLQNEDLLRSHIHSIWLAEADLSLGPSLAHLLDIRGDNPPLTPNAGVLAKLHDRSIRARARVRVQAALGAEVLDLHEGDKEAAQRWLDTTLDGIPQSFVAACERWRSLFLAAHTQARQQQKIIEDRSRPATERDQARRLRREAESQLDLLVDQREGMHSSFYPFRYLASEGFLPGYNFPRLPLSAYLDHRRNRELDDFLSRPRFLAVSEFGPRSIIYHEGARYVTSKVILGAGSDNGDGSVGLLERAVRCEHCGAIEPLLGETAPDLCCECGAGLGAPTINFFRMRNVTAFRRDRITSDEEERLRMGYDLRTAVHFPVLDGRPRRYTAALIGNDGEHLATLTYGHGADIWRINMGWRRRKDTEPPGFQLDIERGVWVKSQNPEDPDQDPEEPSSPRQERVIPFVKDTRNCLLIEPTNPLSNETMASLQAALKTAIQREFQLEDRELAAEPLPSRAKRQRILLYEAAEGGAGVLRRLLDEPSALERVAEQALELCHFDPASGRDLSRPSPAHDPCVAACYDCLLSYFNQPDHPLVDRHLLHELLLRWRDASIERSSSEAPREDHRSLLLAACESELERRFVNFLAERGYNLPTRAQVHLPEANTRVDFLYQPDRGTPVPVFIDGPPHDGVDVARRDTMITEQLEDIGYLVIRFHHASRWEDIVARYPSVFGTGTKSTRVESEPEPPAALELDEDLLELFDPKWRPAIRQIAASPNLVVDAGGELGERVAASYHARVELGDRTLYIVDAAAPDADKALKLLQSRGDRALALRADAPDPLTAVLQALGG